MAGEPMAGDRQRGRRRNGYVCGGKYFEAVNDDALLVAEKSDRITVQVSFSEPDLGRCGMVFPRKSPDDPVPELVRLSFGAANDNSASHEFRIPRLVWRALAIWIGTALVGGAVLAAMMSFVAGVFGAPEFAEHQRLGYLPSIVGRRSASIKNASTDAGPITTASIDRTT